MLIYRLLLPICFAILCHGQAVNVDIVRPMWDQVQEPTGQWNVPLLWWDHPAFPVYPSPEGGNTIILQSMRRQSLSERNNKTQGFQPAELWRGFTDDHFSALAGNTTASFNSDNRQSFPLGDFAVANSSYATLPDGRQYNLTVGNVQLGPNFSILQGVVDTDPGITGSLFASGEITSPSYALNFGSRQLGLPGSLTFGGYDENRAIGDVGLFDIVFGSSRIFMRDIVLGVHEGQSPFPRDLNISSTASTSVWQGAGNYSVDSGAPYGAIVMNITGEYSGFLMSKENCDAVAKNLPVTWQPDIGFYTWNTADVRYKQITTSPAYLGFVLSDRQAKNITVKVPFAYLTNMLDKPIVSKQTPYFPCQPGNYPTVMLGRAFMQSAFIASNFATNISYIAQGPGPKVDQTIVKAFPTDGTTLSSSPSDSFSKTWSGFWTPIPDPAEKQKTSSSSTTLSAGQVAGIVVGVVLAAVMAVLGAWYIWYQRKKKRAALAAATKSETTSALQEADSSSIDKKDEKNEVDAEDTAVHELAGSNIQQEMGGEAIAELEA